ncbi:hypothetical protein, partial [Enterococcus casseliflavus]|uniref:hypothetical protein n=1 Tax=Enterococcus casseliflavus TaxID=37734 RepID=UPI003D0F425D
VVYYAMLDAFTEAIPVDDEGRRVLSSAGRLFGAAVQHLDILVDDPGTRMDVVAGALATLASCFEGQRLCADLFPPSSPFWPRLRGLFVELAG